MAEGEGLARAGGGDRRLHRAEGLARWFGSLLLAVREGEQWRYVGRAGSGFNQEMLASLYAKLKPLITKTKPVDDKVPNSPAPPG